MYQTCLYCTRHLGTNEVIEPLPVGRRVAFDEAQGRLWVICRACEKWNLVPFDSRLEAIALCARHFGDTRMRFSTGNIGIARLAEGLELVRIGPALRPELAAWRYGDQFTRRRKRAIYVSGAALALGGLYFGGLAVGASMGAVANLFNLASMLYRSRVVAARLPMQDGVGGVLSHNDLARSKIYGMDNGEWELQLQLRSPSPGRLLRALAEAPRKQVIRGEDALTALGHLLPAINANGGSRAVVRDAVTLVEQVPYDRMVRDAFPKLWDPKRRDRGAPLRAIPARSRLAIEMLAHEESERQALNGELKLLERQWREAEELATIADSLALPDISDEQLDALRRAKP